MENLKFTKEPIVKVSMLIRKPVSEVFEAFVNPDITTKFWFTKSTGKLEPGKQITWTWEMYNHSVPVAVKEVVPNKKIVVEWGNYGEATMIEWIFTPYENDTTYVAITNSGFRGDGDKVIASVLDSKGGFAWVLAGAKTWLEHGIEPNLVLDAFPKGLVEH